MLDAVFARAMGQVGVWGEAPRLAVAVSGGPDSMALALLAGRWCWGRGGSLLALIVDHGLRVEAGGEARLAAGWLGGRGVEARILTLRDLAAGPGVAQRARRVRYRVLAEACGQAGMTDLLLGHQAADQAETLMLRSLAGSGLDGLAGMPLVRHQEGLRLVRPLLGVAPSVLRDFLAGQGQAWVTDPSNADQRATRVRLRGIGAEAVAALGAASLRAAAARERAEREAAAWLAARVTVRPEGWALLPEGAMPIEAMAALLRVIGGAEHAAPFAAVAKLAARPMPATLAGVRLLRAGRLGAGLLLMVREAGAVGPPVPVLADARWDGRFRLRLPGGRARELLVSGVLADHTIGALGAVAAARFRQRGLPVSVLRVMPALWREGRLVAAPMLGMAHASGAEFLFAPPEPLACAPFAACPGEGAPASGPYWD